MKRHVAICSICRITYNAYGPEGPHNISRAAVEASPCGAPWWQGTFQKGRVNTDGNDSTQTKPQMNALKPSRARLWIDSMNPRSLNWHVDKTEPGKQDFAQTVLNQCDSCQPATVQGQGKRSFRVGSKKSTKACQRLALMVPTSTNLPLATENQHATAVQRREEASMERSQHQNQKAWVSKTL